MHAEDNVRAGLAPDEARRQAVLAFGGVARVNEEYRDRRRLPLVETTIQDVRYALRTLRKQSGLRRRRADRARARHRRERRDLRGRERRAPAAAAFHDPERLVHVWHVPPPASFPGMTRFTVSAANYLDWQRRQHVFERMAIHHYKSFTLTSGGQPEQLRAQGVSAGFFEVLGVQPLEGRWFLPEEDQPGREHVVILSHRLWQSRFGGDRFIVGRRILLDGVPYTVVGIMGPAFDYPDWAQLWTPLAWTEKERAVRGEHSCLVRRPGSPPARTSAPRRPR